MNSQTSSEEDAVLDAEFQSGLDSIIGPMRDAGASQAELDAVTRRAREFFLHRKRREEEEAEAAAAAPLGASSFTGAVNGPAGSDSEASASSGPPEPEKASQSDAGSVSTPELASAAVGSHSEVAHIPAQADEEPPYPISFDEIAEMIATGKPIPGIREIPDTLNEAPPTEAKVAKLAGAGRKPWERETARTTDMTAGPEDIHAQTGALSI